MDVIGSFLVDPENAVALCPEFDAFRDCGIEFDEVVMVRDNGDSDEIVYFSVKDEFLCADADAALD